jgi:hypothetical protein
MVVKIKSLTLRNEHRQRAFEKRVLRTKFGPKKGKMKEDCIISFITCIPHQIKLE